MALLWSAWRTSDTSYTQHCAPRTSSQHRHQKAVSTQGVADYVSMAEKVSQQKRRVPQLVHALSGYKYRSAGLSRLRSLHARYEVHASDPLLPHACMCRHAPHTPALVLQKPCEDPWCFTTCHSCRQPMEGPVLQADPCAQGKST